MPHTGKRYNIHSLNHTDRYARDGHHTTKGNVLFLDTKTDKIYQRVAFGQDCGNFHPRRVRTRQGRLTLDQILNSETDLFPGTPTKFANLKEVRNLLSK